LKDLHAHLVRKDEKLQAHLASRKLHAHLVRRDEKLQAHLASRKLHAHLVRKDEKNQLLKHVKAIDPSEDHLSSSRCLHAALVLCDEACRLTCAGRRREGEEVAYKQEAFSEAMILALNL
jgi:hypothetical protein